MSNYLYGLTFHSEEERRKFKNVAQQKMADIDLSVRELSEEIGYSRKSVYQFFADDKIANKFLAAAIANRLGINLH